MDTGGSWSTGAGLIDSEGRVRAGGHGRETSGNGAAMTRMTEGARPSWCMGIGLSSGMGGGRSKGTQAGMACTAVRARTSPPYGMQNES